MSQLSVWESQTQFQSLIQPEPPLWIEDELVASDSFSFFSHSSSNVASSTVNHSSNSISIEQGLSSRFQHSSSEMTIQGVSGIGAEYVSRSSQSSYQVGEGFSSESSFATQTLTHHDLQLIESTHARQQTISFGGIDASSNFTSSVASSSTQIENTFGGLSYVNTSQTQSTTMSMTGDLYTSNSSVVTSSIDSVGSISNVAWSAHQSLEANSWASSFMVSNTEIDSSSTIATHSLTNAAALSIVDGTSTVSVESTQSTLEIAEPFHTVESKQVSWQMSAGGLSLDAFKTSSVFDAQGLSVSSHSNRTELDVDFGANSTSLRNVETRWLSSISDGRIDASSSMTRIEQSFELGPNLMVPDVIAEPTPVTDFAPPISCTRLSMCGVDFSQDVTVTQVEFDLSAAPGASTILQQETSQQYLGLTIG